MEKENTKICSQCKSEIPADAKRCPNCRCTQWNKKEKKIGKIVLKAILGIFALLFIVIIVLALNTPSVEDKCANAKFVTLEEVYNIHSTDVTKAKEMYEGKYFKFTGTIGKKYDKYFQIASDYINADVYFNVNYKDKANELNVGDKITYCGKISYSTSVQVKNAMIINED